MRTKQIIAVIGATGSMGAAISKSLSKGNYKLLLSARDFNKTQLVVKDILSFNSMADVEAIDCSVNASWEADIIILAVPFQAEKAIAEKIKEVANQKVVISISNPLKKSNTDLTAADICTAEELQKLLPNSKVIKAFNTIVEADFSTPIREGKIIDAIIVGDDADALQIAEKLVSLVGFKAIKKAHQI